MADCLIDDVLCFIVLGCGRGPADVLASEVRLVERLLWAGRRFYISVGKSTAVVCSCRR